MPGSRDGRSSWRQVRTIAAWTALLAVVSLLAADVTANSLNPAGWYMPWYLNSPMSRSFEMALEWRKLSLLAAVLFSLVSWPRWQSLLALALTIGYLAFVFMMFD